MQGSSRASNLGIYVYAAGAIFLGVLGLASGDFATTWCIASGLPVTRQRSREAPTLFYAPPSIFTGDGTAMCLKSLRT